MSKHPESRRAAWLSATAAMALCLLLCGCGKPAETNAEVASVKTADADETGLLLDEKEIAALGLTTAAARPIRSAPEVRGFAAVLPHEAIAQLVADLRNAVAGVHQSQAAVERVRQLADTPGALAAETRETAERQAAADRVAVELARQRLTSMLGQDPPWKDPVDSPALHALASGETKLIRITLPVAAPGDRLPGTVRVARTEAVQGGKSWHLQSLWRAPADATVPGATFFAMLDGADLGEGEHLLAWAPAGAVESGVAIPAAAAVVTGGRFYCYVEHKPGTYERVEFDPGRAVEDGYFVKAGIEPGAKIVVTGAGQLLARETNPDKEAD